MIDPEAAAAVAMLSTGAAPMPADQETWLQQYRASLERLPELQGPPPAMDVVATGCPGSAGNVGLRLYRPAPRAQAPTAVFCHGGGFVAGSLDAYDVPLRWLAQRSGWQVVAVDYRLAPESPYPAGLDDCLAALRFVARGALGADPGRLAVLGDSAGGLLAAVLARHARAWAVPLALQALLYPNMDLREDGPYPSRTAFDGTVIRVDELYRSLRLYLGSADRMAPDVSPGLAQDLAGLCPALIVTNEVDPLRDEGEMYAARLATTGIVDARRLPGMVHGALQMAAVVSAGDTLISTVAAALRAA